MEVEEVIAAINRFHGDQSRSAKETLDGLLEIQDHIEPMIDVLRDETANEG